MDDETFASLMEMGFSSTDCKLAAEFGCVTLEEAVNHLTSPIFVSNVNNTQTPVLTLNKNSTEQLRITAAASDESGENQGFLIHSRCSVAREAQKLIADKKLASLKEETMKMKQLKRIEHDAIVKEVQADKRARQELKGQLSTNEIAREDTDIKFAEENVVRSRYSRNTEEETKWNKKMQQKAKDDMQREQKIKEDARIKVLLDIQQDRLNRAQNVPLETKTNSEVVVGPVQTAESSPIALSDFATFRFRFPDGNRVEEKFKVNSSFSVVAHFVASKLKLEPDNFTIAESFPPFKCYSIGDHGKSLKDLNFRGAVSLVVKRSTNEQPMQLGEAEPISGTAVSNDQSSSEEENDEIPYEPLVEHPVGLGENIQDHVEENADIDIDENHDMENFHDGIDEGDEDGDDDGFPPAGLIPRAGIAFNIAQRLGGQDSSGTTLGDEQQTLSVDALRQQRCQALLNRISENGQASSTKQIEALKYSCDSLRNLASENVLDYFLQQKLFLSNLDFASSKYLIEMLKAKNLLNSKTFRPFIQSCFEIDLSSYRFLTNDLINAISLSKVVQKLNLKSGENLTDAALERISEMQQLRSLDISFCSNFTSSKICSLVKQLPNLEILKATGTKVSTASMESTFWHTESFPNIVLLDLSDTLVNDVSNFQLWFPNMRHLSLNGISFTQFNDAASLECLRELYLANCTVPIQGLLGVTKLVDLESLHLTNAVLDGASNKIYSEFLQNLLSLKKFRDFKPPKDPLLGDAELELIGKLNLAEIDLSNSTKISDAGFENYMMASCSLKEPKISVLLASNTHFSFRATTFLSKLKNLTELNLDYTQIGDDGVQNIQGLPSLSSLSLVGNHLSDKIFTDANSNSPGESSLFSSLTSLTKLNLSRNENISNFGLKRLRVCGLETLAVMHTKVTNAVEDVLKTNMPCLRAVRF